MDLEDRVATPSSLSSPWLFTLYSWRTLRNPAHTSREALIAFPAPASQLVLPQRETTASGVTQRPWWERIGGRHSSQALLGSASLGPGLPVSGETAEWTLLSTEPLSSDQPRADVGDLPLPKGQSLVARIPVQRSFAG